MNSNIREFNSYKELEDYVLKDRIGRFRGEGNSGKVYKGKDKYAYKLIVYPDFEKLYLDNIITSRDIQLSSFAFPHELYVVDGEVRGYKSDFYDNDLFSADKTYDIRSIKNISLNKLSKAYKIMEKDVILLSKAGILIDDMPNNVIFDGDRLHAIDTCSYKQVGYDTYNENMTSYNEVFRQLFSLWYGHHKFNVGIKGNDIDGFLNEVYNHLPITVKPKVDKIKRK